MTEAPKIQPDRNRPSKHPGEWVVKDANILIDLLEIDLFDACVDTLNLSILVPDVVVAEIQSHSTPLEDAIKAGRTTSVALTPAEVTEIAIRQSSQRALSFQDHAALFIAELRQCTLLTGDRRLRKEAENAGIDVHGLLWIMDRLARAGYDRSDLHTKLSRLLDSQVSRLPRKECQRLLSEWKV